jgi:fumarylacetoacetase
VGSANPPECGFPLENLPFCAFVADGEEHHLGVGIGDAIVDLRSVADSRMLVDAGAEIRKACGEQMLNELMLLGRNASAELRTALTRLLAEDADEGTIARVKTMMRPMEGAEFRVPVAIGDYTDFYASVHHATNVGKLFRPDQPLLPNYKWLPIGYHGRASSVVVSGRPVKRPCGQRKAANEDAPSFGPSRQMDYELELGAWITTGNALGDRIDIDAAEQYVFGLSMVNDWSARDIQAWEYQPLGPFLGKSFATTVSPWVVTMEALEPYRAPLDARAEGDPRPLEYLRAKDAERQGIDVRLEVYLASERMRAERMPRVKLSEVRATELYWSFAQMVTHHASNGCNVRTGDLLASGTISGPRAGEQGCLLEITKRGAEPLRLTTGEERSFLEDGDEVTFVGYCEAEGRPKIALGECTGRIVPATLASRASNG